MSYILTTPDADTYRIDLGDGGGAVWCYRTPAGTRYASAGADKTLLLYYLPSDGKWPTVAYEREADGEIRGNAKGPSVPNLLPAAKRFVNETLKNENLKRQQAEQQTLAVAETG